MAEQVEVYVKHALKGVKDDIRVARRLPDGTSDVNTAISKGNKEKFYLAGTDISLIISAPTGVDTKDHPIKVKSDIDLMVLCSRANSNCTVRIAPNVSPPDAPLTVNVTMGGDE